MPTPSPRSFTRSTYFALITLLSTLISFSSLSAQDDPPREREEGRQRRGNAEGGERRNFDPSVIRERMAGFLRETLDIQDDAEWAIVGERINRVNELRTAGAENPQFAMRILATLNPNRESNFGGNPNREGGGGGQGGPGGGQNRQRAGGNNAAMGALFNALRTDSSEDELISRLEEFRSAKKTGADQLAKAQEDLRVVLTPRQEAILVLAGMLP